jgi:hypothetical protein
VKSAEKDNGKVSRAELSRLNREYLSSRNRAQAAKAAAAEMEIAQRRGELISKQLAGLQCGYLLTSFRQRCLLEPAAIARRIASLALIDVAKEHDVSEVIRERIHALLRDLSNLPAQVTDPNWLQKIDGDLLNQVDGAGPRESREPRTPVEARAQAEKAKIRRAKKTATMRKLRAEGRA